MTALGQPLDARYFFRSDSMCVASAVERSLRTAGLCLPLTRALLLLLLLVEGCRCNMADEKLKTEGCQLAAWSDAVLVLLLLPVQQVQKDIRLKLRCRRANVQQSLCTAVRGDQTPEL